MLPFRSTRALGLLALVAAVLTTGDARDQPLVRRWNVAANGAWNTNTNWGPAIVPNGANIEADFRSQPNYFGPINISLDIPVTLNRMVFNSYNAYTITPLANQSITLTTFNDNGTTRAPRIVVEAGNTKNQTIAAHRARHREQERPEHPGGRNERDDSRA